MQTFYNPVRLILGDQNVGKLRSVFLNSKKILLLLHHEKALENKTGQELLAILRDVEVDYTLKIFQNSNPEIQDVFAWYKEEKESGYDMIVAIGGGSIMDLGKSLCLIFENDFNNVDELRNFLIQKNEITPKCRWIGIPTTAGTGSEVTCWATIWDKELGKKYSLECSNNYAFVACAFPEFTKSMPKTLAYSSALDALAHSTEAYWAKKKNLISCTYALQAIEFILENLEKENFENMVYGSLLAGLAFSNTRTTAVHGISYALTLEYGIPHGLAVGMLLPAVFKRNFQLILEKEKLLKSYSVNSVDEVENKIKRFIKKAFAKTRLSEYGMQKDEIPLIAERCFNNRLDNNPKTFSTAEIAEILNEIF